MSDSNGLLVWLRDFEGPGSSGTNEAADVIERLTVERDDAVREMEARELHHFEVEEENARLRSIIAAAREEAYSADQGDSFGPIFEILGRAFVEGSPS